MGGNILGGRGDSPGGNLMGGSFPGGGGGRDYTDTDCLH